MSDSLQTEGSAVRVPLISVGRTILDAMPDKEGWVLGTGLPVQSMDEFARQRISEPLRERGIVWRGLTQPQALDIRFLQQGLQ